MQKIIHYRYEIIWALFLITLPFSKALVNVTLVIGLVVFFYDLFKIKNISLKPTVPFFILFLGIIYMAIKAFLKGTYVENLSFFKLYPILIGTYFALFYTPVIKINNIKKIAIAIGLLYTLVCLIRFGVYYTEFNINPFGNSSVINKLLILDRPYAGCFVLLNTLLIFDSVKKTDNRKTKLIYAVFAVLFVGFIVLIAARLALLSLLILMVVYFIFYTKFKVVTKVFFILGIPILLSLLIYSSSGLKQRLFIGESLEVFKDYEPRFVIWKGVEENVKTKHFNLISGTGNYAKNEELLVQHYEKIQKTDKRNYYLNERFNAHNQFLDLLLFGGILALIPFLLVFGILFNRFRSDFTSLAIFIGLILFMLVENIFHRQVGCYLFMIYLILALKINEQNSYKIPNKSKLKP